MWYYDINEEDWNAVSFKSSLVPSPRSDFSHARYLDDFITFGGKGDGGLYNDLYRYNVRDKEWKLISIETSIMPSARKAACMAAGDDFILIYGGIEASGYSNELWKFDWGTRSYTLLDSSKSTPGSAYSQCHIETNSDNQLIFKVYMGETEGDNPTALLYEFNIALGRWTQILEPDIISNLKNSKSAAFMIDNTIINAGGNAWNTFSYSTIVARKFEWNESKVVGSLPSNTYYGASVYYKNKIYIHGGAYSFGDLPLSNIVKNNLIVINLDDECEGTDDLCISDCSKGTYHRNGKCDICPKGSYSDKTDSESCSLCRAGYFSDIIGAETSKTCKPCPAGYFTNREGESMCLECPAGSLCSLSKSSPDQTPNMLSYYSVQPDLLDYKTHTVKENSIRFYIIISVISPIFIAILISFPRTRNFLKNRDKFSHLHNYKEDQAMYIRKTIIGGLFTTAFYFAAVGIVFSMILSYSIDNIRETKALVPLAALEQQYDSVFYI
jgi:hypothetical protein